MLLDAIFDPFVEQTPVTVMVRALMERAFSGEEIDELFDQTAERQYTRELLFSDLVYLLLLVVCSVHPSVSAVYKVMSARLGVSKKSVYNKLNGMEPQIGQALVRYNAEALKAMIEKMNSTCGEFLPGYRFKIVDGNHLGATEHRLAPLREVGSSPLPGQSLGVLDPQLMLAIDYFPCEDAYTQERAILPQILETVEAKDVWMGDRNLCTQLFIFGIAERNGFFILREHQNLPWQARSELKRVGSCDTGEVFEQQIQLSYEGKSLSLRRILVQLNHPTRHGETQVVVLTNLPPQVADGIKISQLYLKRWSVERLFQIVTDEFHCEVKALCYPRAALFVFAMALLAYNLFSVMKAALRSVHGAGKIEAGLSDYYLAEEVSSMYQGMMVAIAAVHWQVMIQMSVEQFIEMLQQLATQVDLKRFSSNPRGPKKKKPKRKFDPKHPHVSTARLLSKTAL